MSFTHAGFAQRMAMHVIIESFLVQFLKLVSLFTSIAKCANATAVEEASSVDDAMHFAGCVPSPQAAVSVQNLLGCCLWTVDLGLWTLDLNSDVTLQLLPWHF